MNIDEILLEWSYRCPKGYPTVVNGKFVDRKEVLILNEILTSRGFESIQLPEKKSNDSVATSVELSAKESEDVLVNLWNAAAAGKGIPKMYKDRNFDQLFKSLSKYAKNPVEVYGKKKLALSPFWIEVTGKKVDTSKTDVLGDKHYSVKYGQAQLMSGAPEEARATLMAAAKKSGLEEKSLKAAEKMLNVLKKYSGKTLGEDMTTGALKKLGDKNKIKEKVNKDAYKIIKAGEVLQKKFAEYLTNLFNSSETFHLEFIYEAMTGVQKFNDKTAIADTMLCIDKTATKIKIEAVKNSQSPYVSKVASVTKLDVNYKTGSYDLKGKKAGYSFFTALRLGTKDLSTAINEANVYLSKQPDGMLTEGVLDFFKGIWSRIVKAYNYIKDIVIKAMDYISQGIQYMLDLFNIEPEIQGWQKLDTIDLYDVA